MLLLNRYRRNVSLTFSLQFFRPGTLIDPAVAPVIADAVYRGVVDHGSVVNVANVCDVNVVDGTIVVELSAFPASAFITMAEVTVSVNDPAVESNPRPPVAFMKEKRLSAPTPPTRSPEEADFGRQHPRTWHPIIIGGVVIVCPVAGRPDVTLGGTGRLLIHRKGRWTDRDGYAYLRE
jgi:hypothetical protein